MMQRAVLMARENVLTADLFPDCIRKASGAQTITSPLPVQPGVRLRDAEWDLIVVTLGATGGNKKEAAKMLGISRRALYNKLRKYNMAPYQ